MFGSLPDYYSVNDTYKDSNDKGFLERYLQVFEEGFDKIHDLVTDTLDIRNPAITPTEILQYLNDAVLNPPAIPNDEQTIRDLLSVIFNLNQIKGTAFGLIKYWQVLGINITWTTEYAPDVVHDGGFTHDADFNYDMQCYNCPSEITISLAWIDGHSPDVIGDIGLDRVNSIMDHLLPLNIGYIVPENVPGLLLRLVTSPTASTLDFNCTSATTVVTPGQTFELAAGTHQISVGANEDIEIYGVRLAGYKITFDAKTYPDNSDAITSAQFVDTKGIASFSSMFNEITSLEEITFDSINSLGNVKDWEEFALNCTNLKTVSGIYMLPVASSARAFQNATALTCITGVINTTLSNDSGGMLDNTPNLLEPSSTIKAALSTPPGYLWTSDECLDYIMKIETIDDGAIGFTTSDTVFLDWGEGLVEYASGTHSQTIPTGATVNVVAHLHHGCTISFSGRDHTENNQTIRTVEIYTLREMESTRSMFDTLSKLQTVTIAADCILDKVQDWSHFIYNNKELTEVTGIDFTHREGVFIGCLQTCIALTCLKGIIHTSDTSQQDGLLEGTDNLARPTSTEKTELSSTNGSEWSFYGAC